jgi:hypothetical protein
MMFLEGEFMTIPVFSSFKRVTRQFAAFLIAVVMILGFLSMPALAASSSKVELGDAPGINEPIPGENLTEMQEQRREWQKQASAANATQPNQTESLGEAIKEKLNLEEITEGYHPEKESVEAYPDSSQNSR